MDDNWFAPVMGEVMEAMELQDAAFDAFMASMTGNEINQSFDHFVDDFIVKIPEVDLSEFQIPTIAEICALIDSIEPGPLPTEKINLDWLAEELAEKVKHLNLPTKEKSWDSVWDEIEKISGDVEEGSPTVVGILNDDLPTAVGQAARLPWSTDRFPSVIAEGFLVGDFVNGEMVGDSTAGTAMTYIFGELKFLEES